MSNTLSKSEFLEKIVTYVRKYAPMYGIKVYSPIIAQAIIESNWGTSNKVINNGKWMHNYFGLKWREDGRCPIATGWFTETGTEQDANTGAYTPPTEMQWCKFASMEDGVHGYFQWTNIPRYSKAKGVTDPREYIQAMKDASYASSVKYVDTIMNKIKELDLTKYDKEEENVMSTEKIVCIDAGHYGRYNRCPSNANYYESEVMWKLHLLQKKYLEQLGIKVITTRADQAKDLALYNRGATSKGCALFISDHTNAVGSSMNNNVDYVAVYHLVDDANVSCDDTSEEIGLILAKAIAEVMGISSYRNLDRKSSNDRNSDGVLNDNYYGVLHGARMVGTPGLILEHSFHTNSKVVEWLLVDSNLDKLARREAEEIASYLLCKEVRLDQSKDDAKDTQKEQIEENVIYRVQIGAYSQKQNAINQYTKAKSKGFEAIVIQVDGLYKVQVGAFRYKSNADNRLASIKSAGFKDAYITTKGGTTVSVTTRKSIDEIAKEVIAGRWGNGVVRKNKLTAEGYNYDEVQKRVRELLK